MSFKSTIITSPDDGLNLKRDIRLVKLSLLYSDKITLVSPKTSMIVEMIQLASLTPKQQLDLLKEIAPSLKPDFNSDEFDAAIKHIKSLKNKARKNREDLIKIGKFESKLNHVSATIKKLSKDFYDDSRFEELAPLIDQQILKLKEFDISVGKDKFSELMINEIISALDSSATSYPIFDDLIGSLAHHYTLENKLEFKKENPDEIEFSKELIFDIPNIDAISVQDVLHLKEELNIELLRFKRLILDYSKQLESQTFSKESKMEIKKQYEYHIKPELSLLREEIKKNKFFKRLLDQFMNNLSSNLAKAGIYMAVCKIYDFEKILSVVGILGEPTYKAYKTMKDENSKIKQNPLFFYNELSNK